MKNSALFLLLLTIIFNFNDVVLAKGTKLILENPLDTLQANKEDLNKEELKALEMVVRLVENNSIEVPEFGSECNLVCSSFKLQFVLGLGKGQCVAIKTSSDGVIEFMPATLTAAHGGFGMAMTADDLNFIKINNVRNLMDYNTWYLSTESGVGLIGAISVKHSTNTTKGKTSLFDFTVGSGYEINGISASVSKVYIDKSQQVISFQVDN